MSMMSGPLVQCTWKGQSWVKYPFGVDSMRNVLKLVFRSGKQVKLVYIMKRNFLMIMYLLAGTTCIEYYRKKSSYDFMCIFQIMTSSDK